jgi:alpha-L-fucosidase
MVAALLYAGVLLPTTVAETPEQRSERMSWFRDGRFGMFVHWGPYAVLGGEYMGRRVGGNPEWIQHTGRIPYQEYEQMAASFNPVNFDAAAIVRTAKDAGMKYVVITAKHHDGFCMWDTKLTDYNIVHWTPFKRDVMAELSNECRKQGIRFGIYYSVRDWHHPDWTLRYVDLGQPRQYNSRWGFPPSPWTRGKHYACGCPACGGNISPLSKEFEPRPTEAEGADMNRYLDYMKGQLEELVSMYKPDLMWFDAQDIVDSKLGRVDEMVATMRSLNPDVIISDRISGEGVFGDYGIHEGKIPGAGSPREWESCITMNGTWGYSKYDKNFKSAETIVRMLVDTASKNGNLLLNVGPDGQGDLPEGSVQSLQDVAKWMAVNGESIYGCGSSGLPSPDWGTFTAKGDHLYVHVFQWPADGQLLMPKPDGNVKQAFLLADPAKAPLVTAVSGKDLTITVPEQAPNAIDSVIVLKLDE